jgi:hypothetical protein
MIRRTIAAVAMVAALFSLPMTQAHAADAQCGRVRARSAVFHEGQIVAIAIGTYDRCWDGTNVFPERHGIAASLRAPWTFDGIAQFGQYGVPGSPMFGQCDQFSFANPDTGGSALRWLCVTLRGDGTYRVVSAPTP